MCLYMVQTRMCPDSQRLQHQDNALLSGGGGGRPWQAGKAHSPEGTPEMSRNQGSELCHATIVPQSDVVADMFFLCICQSCE